MLIRPHHRCWYANVGSHMLMSLWSWWWLVMLLKRVMSACFRSHLFRCALMNWTQQQFPVVLLLFFAVARVWAFFPSLTAGSVLLTSIVPESCSLLAAVQKTIWWIWQLAAFALLKNERATDKRRNDEGSFCLVWSWSSDTLIRVCNTVALSEDRTSLAQVLQQTHFTKTAPPMTDSLL